MASSYVYANKEPSRGDIITFKFPPKPSQTYVKRVIGVSGDKVEITGQQVSVNGEVLDESYIQTLDNRSRPTTTTVFNVPEDQYFVLGDNRDNSADSRHWGFVPRGNIVARVKYVWMSEYDNTGPLTYE